jgi:membrane-associated PAP2 superfamily phosphatase
MLRMTASLGVTRTNHLRLWWATLAVVPLLLAWDASPLDLAAAHWFGGPAGFPLKEHWLFSAALHEGGRYAAWVFVLCLSLMVWWPRGTFRRIDASRRLQLVLTALASVVLISSLKAFSHTSCPWDLAEFGRAARHVSHWAWATADGGSGRCFPAGHASAGFAFLGGYFAFADKQPSAARAWFVGALLAGLVFGLAQQVRGAHFMSHTLWTGWLCWCVALVFDHLRSLAGPALAPAIDTQDA